VKDSYIAAKERWARKMAGQPKPVARSTGRLPPGQRQVHNFPVLDLGLRPEVALEKWELKIHGHVENPVTLNWQQFLALPQFKDRSDFHCVTTWSRFDLEWEGVAFFTIAELVIPKRYAWKGAKFIREITFLDRDILGFWEVRGYSNTADPWAEDRFAQKDQPPPGFP